MSTKKGGRVSPPSPPPHKHGGVCAVCAHRSHIGGAGVDASSTRPLLPKLISRVPSPYDGELPSPRSQALDLGVFAEIAVPQMPITGHVDLDLPRLLRIILRVVCRCESYQSYRLPMGASCRVVRDEAKRWHNQSSFGKKRLIIATYKNFENILE